MEASNSKIQYNGKRKDLEVEQSNSDGSMKKRKKTKTPLLQAYKKCDKKVYPYGNEEGYYGKRIGYKGVDDPRLPLLKEGWFKNKDVLDVGCHEGYIAITLAQMYSVRSICGIDIDNELITKAKNHLKQEVKLSRHTLSLQTCKNVTYEVNNPHCTKYNGASSKFEENEDCDLLRRVSFETTNFLEYKIEDSSIDTILCLSVTKWIHLNWGDEGVKSLFQIIFRVLRPGGMLILEPQIWKSYRKNRKTTKSIHENYLKLTLRPNDFISILINQVGFDSCKVIARTISGTTKGFDRPMYLLTKHGKRH